MGNLIYPVAFIVLFWFGLWLLKKLFFGASDLFQKSAMPFERSTLQWLQDRAMARALGVDIDIIRVRRKIETAAKPIDVPTADGAKHQR